MVVSGLAFGAVLAILFLAGPLKAQPMIDPPLGASQDVGASSQGADLGDRGTGENCAGGLVNDDGVSEASFGWVTSALDGIYLQTFEQRQLTQSSLDEVCVCWRRSETSSDETIDFEVVVYADEGGQPGEQPYGSVPARLEGVTDSRQGLYAQVPTPGLRLPPAGGTFYVGVRWNPSVDSNFFLCGDLSETTEAVRVWFRDDRAGGWGNSFDTADWVFADLRSLMIRPVGATGNVTDVPGPEGLGLALLAAALLIGGVALLRR